MGWRGGKSQSPRHNIPISISFQPSPSHPYLHSHLHLPLHLHPHAITIPIPIPTPSSIYLVSPRDAEAPWAALAFRRDLQHPRMGAPQMMLLRRCRQRWGPLHHSPLFHHHGPGHIQQQIPPGFAATRQLRGREPRETQGREGAGVPVSHQP